MTNLRPLPSDREPIAASGGKASPRWRAWLQRIDAFVTSLFSTANTWTATQTFNAGVKFPATQVPSSDPNTLDDYEEGTWTPVFAFSTPGDSVITVGTALGRYTKTGRTVHILLVLTITTNAYTTASGNAVISGLPFVPAVESPLSMGYTDKITIPANTQQIAPMVTTSSTVLLWAVKTNATASTPLTTAAFPASTASITFYVSGTYYV